MSIAAPPFGITVCGIDELEGHGATNASHVLSILDPEWPVPEAFGTYGEHEKLELRFHDISDETEGQVAPKEQDVERILAFGRDLQREPANTRHLLVHCHAGISRSTASMILILAQAMPERSAEEIVAIVHGIREKAWPNLRIIEFGDAMLNRNGSLVAATLALYRLQMEVRPHIGALMERDGRAREVAAARA
jgi:predicted protein tyrosine phosphatase